MIRPLPCSTLSPLGPELTRLLTITEGTEEGGQASVAAKGKDPLFEEEVDSPHIQSLDDVVFGVSSSEEKKDEGKGTKCGGSSGHKKLAEELSFALGIDTVESTQSTDEDMDEVGFFLRHLSEEELSEEKASELEDKAEAMGYVHGAMLFSGGDKMIMCVLDANESRIVKNITRSIEFPDIEDRLSKIKKRKLSHSLAYSSIKVKRSSPPFLCKFERKIVCN